MGIFLTIHPLPTISITPFFEIGGVAGEPGFPAMITDNPLLPALLPLSYRDTIELCQTSKEMYNLCQTERFWQTKAASKYGKPLPNKTPAQRYDELELAELKYLPLVTDKQIELLNFLSYHITRQDMEEEIDYDRVTEIVEDILDHDPNFYQNVSPSNDVDTIVKALFDLADKPFINLQYLVLTSRSSPRLKYDKSYKRTASINELLLLRKDDNAIKPIDIINKSSAFNLQYGIDYGQGVYTNGMPTLKVYIDPSLEPLSYRVY